MKYKCDICNRNFEFDEDIKFCPFCGGDNLLVADMPAKETPSAEVMLANVIDVVWGDAAERREDFRHDVYSCISDVNAAVMSVLKKAAGEKNVTYFFAKYEGLKKCEDRKELLAELEEYIKSLKPEMDGFVDVVSENTIEKINEAIGKSDEITDELYEILNLPKPPRKFERTYGRVCNVFEGAKSDNIKKLYALLLVAFDKYKRCVMDNNMFAAFANDSAYGSIYEAYSWHRESTDDDKDEVPPIEDVIKLMEQENARKYVGFLDEDFMPHVESFWLCLEKICYFMDEHMALKYDLDDIGIGDDEREKIMRTVKRPQYIVSEEQLSKLSAFREKLKE